TVPRPGVEPGPLAPEAKGDGALARGGWCPPWVWHPFYRASESGYQPFRPIVGSLPWAGNGSAPLLRKEGAARLGWTRRWDEGCGCGPEAACHSGGRAPRESLFRDAEEAGHLGQLVFRGPGVRALLVDGGGGFDDFFVV